jgi:hypothetical protein
MIIWSLGKILSTKKKVLCFSGYVYRGFEHTDLKPIFPNPTIKVLREYLILHEKKNNFILKVKNFIYFFKNKLNI